MGREERLFRFDEQIRKEVPSVYAGVDEAGRGPLAGPVVAAAVIFHRPIHLPGLDDSKKISPALREVLFEKILTHALVGIGSGSVTLIDEINILQATRFAMREAVLALPRTPEFLLIDGRIHLDLPLPQRGIVRGDSRSARIAAASIVAKVYRDRQMRELDLQYPDYGFARHKGYPTPHHLRTLRLKGATSVHRKSFRPVARLLTPAGEPRA